VSVRSNRHAQWRVGAPPLLITPIIPFLVSTRSLRRTVVRLIRSLSQNESMGVIRSGGYLGTECELRA